MLVVYLSGPMTYGSQFGNVREAMRQAALLRDAGCAVMVPQLTAFWDLVYPGDYDTYIAMDCALIERCDLLIRIPGASKGCELEVAHAHAHGIEVFEGTVEQWLVHRRAAAP